MRPADEGGGCVVPDELAAVPVVVVGKEGNRQDEGQSQSLQPGKG